jgi:hypothetical protein
MRGFHSLLVGAAIISGASLASAQDLNTASAQASHGGGSITDTSGPSDHSVVVNRLALRYFGASQLPTLSIMGMNPGAGANATLHTVGLRYWMSNTFALEGGLSFGFQSASSTTTTRTGSMTTTRTEDDPNFFGLGLHVGAPIVLAEAKHVIIHLAPYAALAFGNSSITTGENDNVRDVSANAFQLRLGANLAAELQFGFIGVPQLGLQAQIGAALQVNSFSALAELRRNGDSVEISNSSFGIGTTLGPHYGLQDIINGSISAVWYFGNAPR